MNFYQNIGTIHGQPTVQLLKSTSKLYEKEAKLKNQKVFLLKVRQHNLKPCFLQSINANHLETKNINSRSKLDDTVDRCRRKCLNIIINDCYNELCKTTEQKQHQERKIKNILNNEHQHIFFTSQHTKMEQRFAMIKEKNRKKIEELKTRQGHQYNTTGIDTSRTRTAQTHSNWIENISNTTIPTETEEILALGPKFAIPVNRRHIPIKNIIANIETSIFTKSNEEKDNIRGKTCNIITNFKTKPTTTANRSIIEPKAIQNTKNFVKNNPQIKILKPDKSNKTVIMNTDDYYAKMKNLLDDEDTYKIIERDPTARLQNQNNKIVKSWLELGNITIHEYNQLIIHNALPPKIYGLPKLHKQNIPLRPIVSCVQSPLYKLSKFLADILKNIINDNDYYIKDSWEFKNFIDNIQLPENYTLISLDVTSLYTNIPVNLVIDSINEKWDSIKAYTNLTLEQFTNVIKLTLKSTYFNFDGTFYEQIFGCAMGSPISSVVAQLVLEKLETTVIKKLTYKLPFFKRYVDDCITAVPPDKINDILNSFNSFNPSLQFTIEIAKNNKINFLDLTLHKVNNKMITEWYTKPTWSGRYANFNSIQPISHKRNVATGIIDRAIKLSSPNLRPNAIKKAKNTLLGNEYPEQFINNIIKRRVYAHYNTLHKNTYHTQPSSNSCTKDNTTPKYASLPYVQGLSEQMSNMLRKHNIIVAHRNFNTLNNFYSKLKTKTPKFDTINTIYKIPCNDCNQVYIGQSKQYLKKRIQQHKITKADTALHRHAVSNSHTFDFDNTEILETEPKLSNRLTLEMIHIQRHKNSVNDRTDIQYLSKIYNNII